MMNIKAILMMMIAALAVIAVVLITRAYLTSAAQTPQIAIQQVNENNAEILVATRDLAVGTLIQPEDFEARPWPEKGVNEAYFRSRNEGQSIVGHVVRHSLTMGEPLTRSSLVAQGSRGFLAAALTPGMRASTIQVSPTSGVGGFIFAGDRVDVILSHEVANNNQAAETVLQNVRVLGIDQRSSTEDQSARLAKTVTVEVTPKMAEKIAILPRLGTLTLALRSLARIDGDPDADISAPPLDTRGSYTWGAEVSTLLAAPMKDQAKKEVRVARGETVSVVAFDDAKKPLQSEGEP